MKDTVFCIEGKYQEDFEPKGTPERLVLVKSVFSFRGRPMPKVEGTDYCELGLIFNTRLLSEEDIPRIVEKVNKTLGYEFMKGAEEGIYFTFTNGKCHHDLDTMTKVRDAYNAK